MVSVQPELEAFKARRMAIRKAEHDEKVVKFMDERCKNARSEISRVALKEILIENNRRIQRERQQKTHDELSKIKAQEDGEDALAEASEWKRGIVKQEQEVERVQRPAPKEDDNPFITRNKEPRAQPAAEPVDEGPRKFFRNNAKKPEEADDTGFIRRGDKPS